MVCCLAQRLRNEFHVAVNHCDERVRAAARGAEGAGVEAIESGARFLGNRLRDAFRNGGFSEDRA